MQLNWHSHLLQTCQFGWEVAVSEQYNIRACGERIGKTPVIILSITQRWKVTFELRPLYFSVTETGWTTRIGLRRRDQFWPYRWRWNKPGAHAQSCGCYALSRFSVQPQPLPFRTPFPLSWRTWYVCKSGTSWPCCIAPVSKHGRVSIGLPYFFGSNPGHIFEIT
jgi:hypothetical protein